MRHLFGLLCVCALGLMPVVGCETADDGGAGGTAGGGGSAGAGGSAGGGGSAGDGGSGGSVGDLFPCTEQGIRDAIAQGGGPHTFDCGGPQTLVTVVAQSEIEIDKDVILDGEGYLTVALAYRASEDRAVFVVPESVTAELHGITVGAASLEHNGRGVLNLGMLTLADSVVAKSRFLGIHNIGTLTIANSTVWGNGGIFNEGAMSLTETGVYENSDGAGAAIRNDGTAMLRDTDVGGNHGFWAGGVWNSGMMTVTESTIGGNTCSSFGCGGAGIFNEGTMTLTNSTVQENEKEACSEVSNAGTMMLVNSTTISNSNSGICNSGNLTSVNSTMSQRDVDTIDSTGGTTTLTSCTVIGRIRNGSESTMTLQGSLVGGACDGDITSAGYNIESGGNTCGFDEAKGDKFNVSEEALNLGLLRNNGGPTRTYKPGGGDVREGSEAIDQIPGDACDLTEDQRGFPRPVGDGCDVGSVEVQPEL